MPTCQYQLLEYKCGLNSPPDNDLCILHNPDPEKDKELFEQTLNSELSRQEESDDVEEVDLSGVHFVTRVNWGVPSTGNRQDSFISLLHQRSMALSIPDRAALGGGKQFRKRVTFENAQFHQPPSFDHAEFHQDAAFGGVTFHQGASFESTAFRQNVRFWLAEFHGDNTWGAHFGGAEFSRDASFGSVNFHSRAYFGDAKSHQDAEFLDVEFHQDASFYRVEFRGRAFFSSAEFHRDAMFGAVKFYRNLWFDGVKFNQDASFFVVEMDPFRNVSFRGLTVGARLRFHGVKFPNHDRKGDGWVRFQEVIIQPEAEVIFEDVDLSHTSFLRTDLRSIHFRNVGWAINKERPWFIGRVMRRNALYDQLEMGRIQAKGDSPSPAPITPTPQLVGELYRQLRQNFEQDRQEIEAGDFFIGQMDMRRRVEGQRGSITLGIYRFIALYGESYSRTTLIPS